LEWLHQGEILILTLGGRHAKLAIKCGNLGTDSAFVLGSTKITENLDQFGRSQHLQDANRLKDVLRRNDIQKYGPHLTENTIIIHYRDQKSV
jgi:hypothetical protein